MGMEDFALWLLRILDEKGWTQSELAKRADVNRVSISRIINGERNIGQDVAIKIADALGISREELFRRIGVLKSAPPTDAPTLKQMSDAFAYLTPDEQRLLIGMLRKYVAERKSGYAANHSTD